MALIQIPYAIYLEKYHDFLIKKYSMMLSKSKLEHYTVNLRARVHPQFKLGLVGRFNLTLSAPN